jgi:predicted transcriptional regulator
MKPDLTVKCLRCDGTGRQDLPPEMSDTLKVVIKLKEATSKQIYDKMKCSGHLTLVHNRLEFLRRAGAVKRERKNKRFFYSPTKP